MTSPTAATEVMGVDLEVSSDGVWTAGTRTCSDGSVIDGPIGGVPWPVAVLSTAPASMSAWVTVWVAVQAIIAVGAMVDPSQLIEPASATGSVTTMNAMVTLPVFLTVMS